MNFLVEAPEAPEGVDIDANIAEARKEFGEILDRAARASNEGLLITPSNRNWTLVCQQGQTRWWLGLQKARAPV